MRYLLRTSRDAQFSLTVTTTTPSRVVDALLNAEPLDADTTLDLRGADDYSPSMTWPMAWLMGGVVLTLQARALDHPDLQAIVAGSVLIAGNFEGQDLAVVTQDSAIDDEGEDKTAPFIIGAPFLPDLPALTNTPNGLFRTRSRADYCLFLGTPQPIDLDAIAAQVGFSHAGVNLVHLPG